MLPFDSPLCDHPLARTSQQIISHVCIILFHLKCQIGAPIVVKAKPKSDITQQDVDELHVVFTKAMQSLFDNTKEKHGCSADTKLVIL
jgi:Diacylglycerol acyltransferase